MRVTFFLWYLSKGRGGAERVGAELANHLCRNGHEVSIFLDGMRPLPTAYPLALQVRRVHNSATLLKTRDGLAELRRQLSVCDPDVFVVMGSTAVMLAAAGMAAGTGIPLVISERSNPEIIENERWNRPDRQAVFSGAERIHLLLEGYSDSLHPCLRDRARVIPNACAMPEHEPQSASTASLRNIVAVGRLVDDIKQHSLLIEAFALLREDFPCWRLQIWGEGRDRGLLEDKIALLGLSDRVFLRGEHSDIEQAYKEAEVFCHPSRFEGFPNVVIEAMRHSLPITGFATCVALREIVAPNTGNLASAMTTQSLAEALRPLLADAGLRRAKGHAALLASRRYLPEEVYRRWEDLLTEAASAKGHTHLRVPVHQTSRYRLHRRLENLLREPFLSDDPSPVGDDFFPLVGADNPCRRREDTRRLIFRLLDDSGLFDRAWYRAAYVRGPEFMDPLEHYVRFGADKGNNPSAFFNTNWYRARYMNGKLAQLNPLLHYCLLGRDKDFAPCPEIAGGNL